MPEGAIDVRRGDVPLRLVTARAQHGQHALQRGAVLVWVVGVEPRRGEHEQGQRGVTAGRGKETDSEVYPRRVSCTESHLSFGSMSSVLWAARPPQQRSRHMQAGVMRAEGGTSCQRGTAPPASPSAIR